MASPSLRRNIDAEPSGCIGGYRPQQIGGIAVEPCREGFSPRSFGASVWCCQAAGTEEQAEKKRTALAGTTTTAPSTFSWSPLQQSGLTQLIERASALLRQPTGMTPQERERLYSYVTRGIKAPLAGELQGIEEAYGRAGLVGSPMQISEQEKVKRDVRQQVAQARAKLAIDEQQQKLAGETAGLGAAGGALTQAAAMERAIEEANAARRGEGQRGIDQLLELFRTLFGASSANYGTILQTIMSRISGGNQQQGAGIGDWLPYLGYYAGQKLDKG